LTADLAWFTEQAEICTDLTIQNWRLEEKNHELLAQIEDLQARRSPPASMAPLPLELIDDVVTLDLGEGSTQLSDIDDNFFDRDLDGDTFIGEDPFNSGLDDDKVSSYVSCPLTNDLTTTRTSLSCSRNKVDATSQGG
jgi:hypothetical protein